MRAILRALRDLAYIAGAPVSRTEQTAVRNGATIPRIAGEEERNEDHALLVGVRAIRYR